MNDKDIERLLKCNFSDYLKVRLYEKGMTLRDLSKLTRLDYKVLSKITAVKPKSRNVRYDEFLIIVFVLDGGIENFLDYALERPKEAKPVKNAMINLKSQEIAILHDLLSKADREQTECLFHMLEEIVSYLTKLKSKNRRNNDL